MTNWFVDLFSQGGVAQTILLLCLISIVGLALGKVKVGGVSLGGSFVFFAAIAAGHFASRIGIQTNAAMMELAKNFGLVVFVYTLGLQCGPGFFSSLRKGGVKLNLCALASILLSSACAVLLAVFSDFGVPESIGLLCGSVTSTPALIAAQQAVLDIDPTAVETSHNVASAYAVAYPFSILGVMLCVMILKALFPVSAARSSGRGKDEDTSIVEMRVCNPEIFGKTIHDIVRESGFHFVISRLWSGGTVEIPVSETVVAEGDHLLVICDKDSVSRLDALFGKQENDVDWNRPDIDWNIIDKNLVSKHLRVTKDAVVGESLSNLKFRNKFGVNITKINRAGITLVPSASTTLQFGDRVTVVGDEDKIKAMAKVIGNQEALLNEPRLIPILTGIFLGVLLGNIPLRVPGVGAPVKLGITGGPILVGILMGAFGPRLGITTYTTRSANLMLRQMGITFFFASLGFSVGDTFVETVFCWQGLKWAAVAILLSMIPLLVMGVFNEKVLKLNFSQSMGLLCGSMTNSNALSYSMTTLDSDTPAEAYATVYPLTTFARVFLAQLLIAFLF